MGAIGGFLPLRLPSPSQSDGSILTRWVGPDDRHWLLHNARSALNALWKSTGSRRVWLPAYICAEVASAVPAGVDARYFPLDESLSPNVDFLSSRIRQGDHVMAVDYFGRAPASDFVSFVEHHPEVGWIEDRAHALDPGAPWGDWLLYSARKLIGVPDGGILVARRKALPSLTALPITDFSFVLPPLERFEDRDETDNDRWYASYCEQERSMGVGTQAMSRLSLDLLRAWDFASDRETRRSNFRTLHQRLRRWAFLPDDDIPFAPLGFPIRIRSAETLSRRLARARVFAARHWKQLPSDPSAFPNEHRLASELLTLPCDYRYDESDMHRVADIVFDAVAPA